jgi:predicted ferric reductase
MRIKPLFIFISFFIICIFTYPIFGPLIGQKISASILFYSIGKLMGLIGFLFLSILIISGDTARFFDRFFGMDKIIKFQRKFALFTAIFVIAHPILFILFDKNYSNYLIPNFAFMPLALGIIAIYIFIIVIVCSIFYKKISYSTWQYIHVLTYILFFFGFYHAFKIGSDTSNILIKLIFNILLIGIIIGGVYRAYYKIEHTKFKCYVKEIKWETPNVFTLKLRFNKKMSFKPGQFCFLRLNKDKLYARHPFTISSAPEEDSLNFTIKMAGRFTKIASQLKKGEEVIVDGPFGVFTMENQKKLVFIAGGVGITPFISMIKNQLNSLGKKHDIALLYNIKTKEDIIFRGELDKIAANWFKKVYILSKEKPTSKKYEYGRIREEIITTHIKDIRNSLFYICGPESMKNEVIEVLMHLGVKKENIKNESFFW